MHKFKDSFWGPTVSFTHKQRARFFRDTVDELGVLDDSVKKFLLGDGGAAGEATLLLPTV